MISPIMFVLLSFVPAGILAGFLEVWRYFNGAQGRRLPVTDKLLRSPGESCRRKVEELNDKINEITIWVVGFPATLLVCYVSSNGTAMAERAGAGVWISALVIAAGTLAALVWKCVSLVQERNNYRLGFSGERAVGGELNQLMCEGCFVFHDFPLTDNGNIDHIVVAPSGIFAIETKAMRKGNASASQQEYEVIYNGHALKFPFYQNTRDLAQARNQAARLTKMLKEEFGESLPVKPILTLPGWYVINRGAGDVLVLNPKMIDSGILAPSGTGLSPERMREVARWLDQKCRDVEF